MAWYIPSTVNLVSDDCLYFKSPGHYTVTVPAYANALSFEIIGSGGGVYNTSSTGGNGGYMSGTINVSAFVNQTIHIYVGGPPSGTSYATSSASYITIPTTGPLFAIAGAGGTDGFTNPNTGGHGGGGTFTNNIAYGINGTGTNPGQGGTNVGGTGYGTTDATPPYLSPTNSGNSRPVPETYLEVVGGASNTGGTAGPGGNGYTGGGGSADYQGGGGGGSSYYNPTYTTITASYPGNALPSNILPEYGRNQSYGYVSICFGNYIFINNTISYTLNSSYLLNYTYLDYILVGGGGSGGGGANGTCGSSSSNYGGGGGGSGYLKSSFSINAENNGFTYDVNSTGATTFTIPNNISNIVVSIGNGGPAPGSGCECAGNDGGVTTLTYSTGGTPISIAFANGGIGGGHNSCTGGNGGDGFNGGGGGGGGTNANNSGGTATGGTNGVSGNDDSGGNGGGVGAGTGPYCGSGSADSAGGGGASGTAVRFTSGAQTGGNGGLRQVGVNNGAGGGGSWTGAGGGGGAYRDGDYTGIGPGGTGYAILWLHN